MTKEERKLAQQELKLSAKELKELLSLPLSDEVIFNICIRYIQVHPRNRKFKRKFLHLCSLQNVPYKRDFSRLKEYLMK